MIMLRLSIFAIAAIVLSVAPRFTLAEQKLDILQPSDVFSLEFASGLTVDASGQTAYFVRNSMDINTDKRIGNIWQVDIRSGAMLPVTSGHYHDYSPVLSPSGDRLAYISTASGKPQIHMRWLDSGRSAQLTQLQASPSNLVWRPDGQYLAFQMFVKKPAKPPVTLKGKPEGAKWAKPATFIDDVYYRADRAGYSKKGNTEIFLLSAEGGTPRQLTEDNHDHQGPMAFSADGLHIYYSSNFHPDEAFLPRDSNVHRLSMQDGELITLTERNGPDTLPKPSPDGKLIAYLGYDDKLTNYENAQLYVMKPDGTAVRQVTEGLDRSINNFYWSDSGKSLFILYDDKGSKVIAEQSLGKGSQRKVLVTDVSGLSYGRPYTSGEFVVSDNDTIVYTKGNALRPSDVGVYSKGESRQLTRLNEDAFAHKTLAQVEEIWFESSADGKDIQGWIAYPPGFDKDKSYPLLLEIHGGPVTAYGPHFSMEVQLFAAAGYVVLYTNPRGSSSYGKAFAHTIDKNYPSQDYDDLMSGVDALIEKGFIDTSRLFVTGGSGGGVLTAWTVGSTDRFAAAVVAKPVVNWYSFVLTADLYPFFYKYWFGKKPWEDHTTYMKYSPISLVGNVTTPTMLLTGESDYRTPMSETEQYYQALKLQGVDTAMVRIPGASHSIFLRPSNLMSKVEYILWWFDKHDKEQRGEP